MWLTLFWARLAAEESPCFKDDALTHKEQAACIQMAMPVIGSLEDGGVAFELFKGLINSIDDTKNACRSIAEEPTQMFACKAMIELSVDVAIRSLASYTACALLRNDNKVDPCDGLAVDTYKWMSGRFTNLMRRYGDTPISKIAKKIEADMKQWPTLKPGQGIDKLLHHAVDWCGATNTYIRGFIWETIHWRWVQECLEAKKVVHSLWGGIDRWEELGAHDANNLYELPGKPPFYHFAPIDGMRWNISVNLIKSLPAFERNETIAMIEVGVFAGHFSQVVLEQIPNLVLKGIDPYIGDDGSYPGNFSYSDELPDKVLPYLVALETYEKYPDRAQLIPGTSKEIAPQIPDNVLDFVFIDGCHLYECIHEDLTLWIPKVKPGGIICGHDFSPQWPGVVRAVHEFRGGQDVILGMDWMYWWYK